MTTFARLWVILATSYLAAGGLLAVVVQHTIDLRFEVLIQYASIPFLQAAVVSWLVGEGSLGLTVRELGFAIRKPLVAGLWCTTALLLACYWLPAFSTDLSRLLLQLAGVEAMVAAFLLVSGSVAGGRIAIWKTAPFALLLALLASNAGAPWLGGLPRLLPSAWPLLVRQTLLFWALLLIFLVLAAAAGSAVERSNRTSAFFLSAASPLAIAAALAVSLNWAFYSYPMEPWLHVFVSCVFIGAAAILTAALFLHLKTRIAGTQAPTAVGREREVGLVGLWLILTMSAVAGMACLQALVYGQWTWGIATGLSLSLPPLVQAAWLRFSREIRVFPSAVPDLFVGNPRLSVLIVAELAAMVWFWNSAGLEDLDGGRSRTVLAVYAALKVAILGAIIFAAFRGRYLQAAVLGGLAAITGIAGIGCGLSGTSLWLPIFGLLFVRWAMARGSRRLAVEAGDDRSPAVTSHVEGRPAAEPGETGSRPVENREHETFTFHLRAADALLAPALVLGVGCLVSPSSPMIVSAPLALSMAVISASASAGALMVWSAGGGSNED